MNRLLLLGTGGIAGNINTGINIEITIAIEIGCTQ